VIEEETLYPALVEDYLREARESRYGVRYAVRSANYSFFIWVLQYSISTLFLPSLRTSNQALQSLDLPNKTSSTYPHTNLQHVVTLLPHPIRKSEAIENLQAPTLETIGLAREDLGSAFIHYTC
jgi:hypothetical protein